MTALALRRKPYGPHPGTAGRCPKCKSTRTATDRALPPELRFYGREISVCGNCSTAWEPIAEGQIWDTSDPQCSFREPCANCAFRPGSPEQADTAKWSALIASLKAGAGFYCHKGVPIDPGSQDGFAYPHGPDRKPRSDKLRLCRGYLNALGKWWKLRP